MQGIVSFLDPYHSNLVQEVKQELADACGLALDLLAGPAHISWHVAESYAMECLKPELAALAIELNPLTVRTAGLGLFTGETPILYIAPVKDAQMDRMHRAIWASVSQAARESVLYYAPDVWVPHISLVIRDGNRDRLGCMLEKLALRPFNWQFQLDNLAVAIQDEDETISVPYQLALGK